MNFLEDAGWTVFHATDLDVLANPRAADGEGRSRARPRITGSRSSEALDNGLGVVLSGSATPFTHDRRTSRAFGP
jgi:hypothetical protein